MGREERIAEFEEELRTTKYNKKTQHHIGLVKAKLARLKEEHIKKSAGKAGLGYDIKKTGDATVVLLGFPSVGKSTILNKLTNAQSQVAEYDFTTLTVIPGLLDYNNAKIQILDLPGIVYGAASGRGRGKEVLAVIRNADLIVIILDALNPQQKAIIEKEVHEAGVRLNQKKPYVKITKKPRGGICVGLAAKLTKLNARTIQAMLREMGIANAEILIKDDISDDELIDAIEGNKVYIPSLIVVNKADLLDSPTIEAVKSQLKPDIILSAEKGIGIDELKRKIFERLSLIRIYLKEIGKKPDMNEPLIMQKGCTICDVCNRLHKDFVRKFKFARVWGSSKFDGQVFRKLDRQLFDGDVLELHI